jgi:hypothetical protein
MIETSTRLDGSAAAGVGTKRIVRIDARADGFNARQLSHNSITCRAKIVLNPTTSSAPPSNCRGSLVDSRGGQPVVASDGSARVAHSADFIARGDPSLFGRRCGIADRKTSRFVAGRTRRLRSALKVLPARELLSGLLSHWRQIDACHDSSYFLALSEVGHAVCKVGKLGRLISGGRPRRAALGKSNSHLRLELEAARSSGAGSRRQCRGTVACSLGTLSGWSMGSNIHLANLPGTCENQLPRPINQRGAHCRGDSRSDSVGNSS